MIVVRLDIGYLSIMAELPAQRIFDEPSDPRNALTFDDLMVGMTASFHHRITIDEIERFAALSGDTSPMHLSDDAAIEHGLDGRIPHGMLLGALASRMVGVHLPGPNGLLQSMKLTFVRPAPIDEDLLVLARIEAKSPATHTVVLKIRITEANTGYMVVRGAAQVGVLNPEG